MIASFLWLKSYPLCTFLDFPFPFTLGGHLGCFIFLTIVNSVTAHIGMQMFLQHTGLASLAYIPVVGLLYHMPILLLNIKNLYPVFHGVYTNFNY